MTQGSGSSMGATYDSQNGHLTLEHAVELTTQRGGRTKSKIHAQHAEFDRGAGTCWMRCGDGRISRRAGRRGSRRKILFRNDGSAVKLDATDGFTLTTADRRPPGRADGNHGFRRAQPAAPRAS